LSQPPTLFGDFYKAYWIAGQHLWDGGLNAGYPFLPFKGDWSNLPILAWPFALLVPLGRDGAGWVYLGAGYAIIAATWLLLVRAGNLRAAPATVLLCLIFLNGPLINSLREGNSTHWVLLFLALGLVQWQARRDFAAGLAFGMCATIKPALLLLGVYFLIRRRVRVAAGGATIIGLALMLSIANFGLAAHIDWFTDTIAYHVGKAMPAYNVQTIDGFLIRLNTGSARLLDWGSIEPSLVHKAVRYGLVAAIFAGLGWMMLAAERRRETSPEGAPGHHDALQLSTVLLIALTTSPISWTHYYIYALVPLALYMGGKLPLPDDAATRILFWTGYGLTSLPVLMPDHASLNPSIPQSFGLEVFARTAASAWVFGGLMMLACFARGAWLGLRGQEARRAHRAQSLRPEPA
jgi:hypothetical protein